MKTMISQHCHLSWWSTAIMKSSSIC